MENVLKDGFSEEKFCETAAQRQLPYGPGHYFRLICLMPEIKSNKREIWDTATMEFVIENVLSELYEETDIAVDTVFYQEPGIYWIVTQSKEKAFPQDGGRDCEILRQFVAWMNEKSIWSCGAVPDSGNLYWGCKSRAGIFRKCGREAFPCGTRCCF